MFKFDMIFIDGDHSYDIVKSDHQNYTGKYYAFHDILGLRDCEGVKKYWQELKQKNKPYYMVEKKNIVEFIADQNPSGIGIIYA